MSGIELEIKLDYGLCETETENCEGEEITLTALFDYEPGTDFNINSASDQPNDVETLDLCSVRNSNGNIVLLPDFMERKIERLGRAYIAKIKSQSKPKSSREF